MLICYFAVALNNSLTIDKRATSEVTKMITYLLATIIGAYLIKYIWQGSSGIASRTAMIFLLACIYGVFLS